MWGNGARAFISHQPVVLGTFLHPCMQPNRRTLFRFASSYKLLLHIVASFTLFVCFLLLQSFCCVEKAHVTDTDLLPRGLTVCTHGAPHCDEFHANSVCHAASLSKMKEAKQGAQCGKSFRTPLGQCPILPASPKGERGGGHCTRTIPGASRRSQKKNRRSTPQHAMS